MSAFELKLLRQGARRSRIIARDTKTNKGATGPYLLKWDGWRPFKDYWDKFVKNWFESLSEKREPDDSLTQAFREACAPLGDGRLDVQELPEPYYGDGESAKGVLVHLNPGSTDKKELSKVFGTGGFLIGQFEKECKKTYSQYAKEWSSLRDYGELKNSKICGHQWWHKANRVNWVRRFFEATMDDVFALEACPYHSKSWKGSIDLVEKHIIEQVVTPAVVAASGTRKKVAVFIGSEFNELMLKIIGVKRVKVWQGTRTYSLYNYIPSSDSNVRQSVFLLVIDGTQGMWLPRGVEKNLKIEDEISRLI